MNRRMTIFRPNALAAVALMAAVALVGSTARAQQNKGPPNALQGFTQNSGLPVNIKAGSLEVRDKDKKATFSGDVHVTQGDTEIRCKVLVIYYEDTGAGPDAKAPKTAAKSPPDQAGGQQAIRRMEARGGVVVTQKDQVASGDSADFDMRANSVTLIGNVVVTRGQDVLRGKRLLVNLTTGVSRMESGGGRVEGMFQSAPGKDGPGQPPRTGR
jgi:lipopolysaccharide export system protein LptA